MSIGDFAVLSSLTPSRDNARYMTRERAEEVFANGGADIVRAGAIRDGAGTIVVIRQGDAPLDVGAFETGHYSVFDNVAAAWEYITENSLSLVGKVTLEEYLGAVPPVNPGASAPLEGDLARPALHGTESVAVFTYRNVARLPELPPHYCPPPSYSGAGEGIEQVPYDSVTLVSRSNTKQYGAVAVYASKLDAARKTITEFRNRGVRLAKGAPRGRGAPAPAVAGEPSPEERRALREAQEAVCGATTSIHVREFNSGKEVRDWRYEMSSVPLFVYLPKDASLKTAETLRCDIGVEIPWGNARVALSRGKEALRCTIFRAFNHVFLVYERQIIAVPVTEGAGNTLTCEVVIGTSDITLLILEAASRLLINEQDVAVILVFTPETGAITTNEASGWAVIEGNIPPERVAAAMTDVWCQSKDLSLPSKAAAADYMSEHWRNFVHAWLEDGSQVVVFSEKMRYAVRTSSLPLARLSVSRCSEEGGLYLNRCIAETVEKILGDCSYHATSRNNIAYGAALRDSLTLFYDHQGRVNFASMLQTLNDSFYEQAAKDASGNQVFVLQIAPDFAHALDCQAPHLSVYQHKDDSAHLIENGVCGAKEIYESYMERFVRAVITAIYVNYGRIGPLGSEGAKAPRIQLAHALYRSALRMINSRAAAFTILYDGYSWLAERPSTFITPFTTAWNAAWEESERASTGAREHAPRGRLTGAELHRNILCAYIINRPNLQFSALEPFLHQRLTEWIAAGSPTSQPKNPRATSGAHSAQRPFRGIQRPTVRGQYR